MNIENIRQSQRIFNQLTIYVYFKRAPSVLLVCFPITVCAFNYINKEICFSFSYGLRNFVA